MPTFQALRSFRYANIRSIAILQICQHFKHCNPSGMPTFEALQSCVYSDLRSIEILRVFRPLVEARKEKRRTFRQEQKTV